MRGDCERFLVGGRRARGGSGKGFYIIDLRIGVVYDIWVSFELDFGGCDNGSEFFSR